jgi:hypothetical protein
MAYNDQIESRILDRRYIQKSRKEHKCVRCGGIIPVGSEYVYEVGLVDGQLTVQKKHLSPYCYEPWAKQLSPYCDELS